MSILSDLQSISNSLSALDSARLTTNQNAAVSNMIFVTDGIVSSINANVGDVPQNTIDLIVELMEYEKAKDDDSSVVDNAWLSNVIARWDDFLINHAYVALNLVDEDDNAVFEIMSLGGGNFLFRTFISDSTYDFSENFLTYMETILAAANITYVTNDSRSLTFTL